MIRMSRSWIHIKVFRLFWRTARFNTQQRGWAWGSFRSWNGSQHWRCVRSFFSSANTSRACLAPRRLPAGHPPYSQEGASPSARPSPPGAGRWRIPLPPRAAWSARVSRPMGRSSVCSPAFPEKWQIAVAGQLWLCNWPPCGQYFGNNGTSWAEGLAYIPSHGDPNRHSCSI